MAKHLEISRQLADQYTYQQHIVYALLLPSISPVFNTQTKIQHVFFTTQTCLIY